MASVRSFNTRPEIELRRALWRAGLRGWRVHARDLVGRPDIVFRKARLAIFVDGAFWHGHKRYYWPGRSSAYWDTKIARNVLRDRKQRRELRLLGWRVVRVWDFEVLADSERAATKILREIM
jgi:DNA mismatch endonuclease (patch repair protein)